MKLKKPKIFKTRCFYCDQPLHSKKFKYLVHIIGLGLACFYVLQLFVSYPMWHLFLLSLSVDPTYNFAEVKDYVNKACENLTDWERCEESYVFSYVYGIANITYEKDEPLEEIFMLYNDPKSTFTHGGDCDNQASLMVSILKSMYSERKYWFVSENGHVCVMARHKMFNTTHYYYRFYGCNGKEIRAVLQV